jgi:hypothetical protein
MVSKHMTPTVDDINSAVGFAVETADDLLRELDEAQEPTNTKGTFVEPEREMKSSPRPMIQQCIFEQHRQRCQNGAELGSNFCLFHGHPAFREVEPSVVETPKAKVLAADILSQALYDWSSGMVDEPSCRYQAEQYLNGYEVSPLIKTVFDYVVAEAKEKA